MLTKLRFIASTSLLYLLTIGTVGYLVQSSLLLGAPVHADTKKQRPVLPDKTNIVIASGKPVRVVIPDHSIDLFVDEGYYDSRTGTWTLSDTKAQFAMISSLANNTGGNTFLYGHGTDAVFGTLNTTPPTPLTTVQLYTDTKQVFTYRFTSAANLTPTDTSVFEDMSKGPARLTIQTCSGPLSEWRTMFTFTFEKVQAE